MIGSFRILEAKNSLDRLEWISIWDSWRDRDVAAHPDYVGLFAREIDQVCCAIEKSLQGCIMFPFIMRPLKAETWTTDQETAFDVVSPYGYGGPFVWGFPSADSFWHGFQEWACKMNVISCFVRLSLFAEGRITVPGCNQICSQNVVRTLSMTLDEIWFDYEHKVRKNVKKARNNELEIQIDLDGQRLDDFMTIYQSTMDRRGAANSYYFTLQFFLDIIHKLPGQFAFFHALHKGQVVSTELVLVSQQYIYSFLGGTLAEAFALRPNDLLKHSIIAWGISQEKRAFIIGGGYTDNDGIFQYKKSFAPNGVVPFLVSKLILDEGAYDRFCVTRRKFETQNGNEWSPKPGYFPEYRG